LKVTIIITSYNKGPFLRAAIESALNQKYKDFGILIIDDGSIDESKDVIESYQKNSLVEIHCQENKGVVETRNKAISLAKGEYVLQLDGDDKLGDNFLSLTVPILENDKNVGIVYCNTSFFGSKNGFWDLGEFTLEKQLRSNQIVITALFRKSDFLKTEGYSHDFDKGYEDWDLWMSILELKRTVVKIESVQFYYRILSGSRNIGISAKIERELKYNIWKNHQSLYDSIDLNPVNLLWDLEKLKLENKELSVKVNSIDFKFGRWALSIPRFFIRGWRLLRD
jgi:glycosyltransferase involved in cell wall biosynthesis